MNTACLQQEGSLCAQHCLNALLQGNYFTAVDLADIAKQLDESERQQMAEAGTDSAEYRRFLQVSRHTASLGSDWWLTGVK